MHWVIMPDHTACLSHILPFTVPNPSSHVLSLYTLPSHAWKWACLQESYWVDAMMSGHRAAAFLTCVRPWLPFPLPGKVHKAQVVSQAVRHISKCPTWWAHPGPGDGGGEHKCVIWVCSPLLLPSVSSLTTFS